MSVNLTILNGSSVRKNQPPKPGVSPPIAMLPGYFSDQHMSLRITSDILSRHALMAGGTGSGKTNVFNHFVGGIKSQLTKDDVMIIFDTKGDYLKRFYRPGDYVISNSNIHSAISSKWNIFKEIVIDGYDNRDITLNTNEITSAFFRDAIEKSSQPFFPQAARDLLAALIISQIRMGESDLEYRKKFFNNGALRAYLDRLTHDKIIKSLSYDCFSDLAFVLSYIGEKPTPQSLGVIAEMHNAMNQILRGVFAEDGRFSIRDFVRQKGAKTLFIEYDLSAGETLTPIYRLLFDLALKEALGRKAAEGNVYLICDEFKLLPNLTHIEDGVNFGRSLGVKILAGIQSIEQLYEIYGTSRGKNIAAGFSTVIAFRANDSSTREFVSDLYGKNTVLEQYRTSGNTLSEEKREGKTVEDWDLMELEIGEAIVGLPFEKPFKFKFDLFRG